MSMKLVGAVLIIAGCAAVGLYLSTSYKREEDALRQLISVLDYMGCELQYRLTPLPVLCRDAAAESSGCISTVMLNLANELDSQVNPDASTCMSAAIARMNRLPDKPKKLLLRLGGSLGRYDMMGQLRGIENTRQLCRKELEEFTRDRTTRLRNYQTLAICAGVALTILFI